MPKTKLSQEVESLQKIGVLPDSNYLSSAPYHSANQLYQGLAQPIGLPMLNGLLCVVHAVRALWAALRTVGNILIVKPNAAGDAFSDFATHTTLSLALAVMAPVHVLAKSLEVLIRTISSWFSAEPTTDLKGLGFGEKISKESPAIKTPRFFTPHQDVVSFIGSVAAPFYQARSDGFYSLYHAVSAVKDAIDLIANIAIAKPQHAAQSLSDLGADLTLTLEFAMAAPIHALLHSIECITRLGATWGHAVMQNEAQPTHTYG